MKPQTWKIWKLYIYQDLVEPTSLPADLSSMFTEVASLLNYRVKQTVIINNITQDKYKVLGDNINKTFKLHRLEMSTEESVSIFQIVVEAEKKIVDISKNDPWQKAKNLPAGQTRNRGWIIPSRDVK